jgi:hypothetical protein
MQKLLLLSLLVGPYVILTGLSRWTGFKTAAMIRARIGIRCFSPLPLWATSSKRRNVGDVAARCSLSS